MSANGHGGFSTVSRVQRTKLAVEVGRLYLQRAQGFDGALISMRPIQAGSGEQLDLVAIDARVASGSRRT